MNNAFRLVAQEALAAAYGLRNEPDSSHHFDRTTTLAGVLVMLVTDQYDTEVRDQLVDYLHVHATHERASQYRMSEADAKQLVAFVRSTDREVRRAFA